MRCSKTSDAVIVVKSGKTTLRFRLRNGALEPARRKKLNDNYLAKDPDPRKWYPGKIDQVVIGKCSKCGQSLGACRGQHRDELVQFPSGNLTPQPLEELETTKEGGKQAKLSGTYIRYPNATNKIAEVSKQGADKYGEDNWLSINLKSHLDHALYHINKYLSGDTTEDHLAHAGCRIMMALEKDALNSSSGEST